MHMIRCPHCGLRMEHEFTYGGDATVALPADTNDPDAMFEFVYQRDNPRGPHWEWWQHTYGCRAWIKVKRDTFTHEILETTPADKATPMRETEGADV